jgi:UDP-N-acetylmuramoyl-L-alanyl-D-glutamate--2,6-diaminopimelate ligase
MNTAKQIMYETSLKKLLIGLVALPAEWSSELDTKITGIQLDSRRLSRGDLFLASFGKNHDARDYIDYAIEHGAAAVLAESGGRWSGFELRCGVPILAVDNLSALMSEIASRFFADPSQHLQMVGVTGTNGKTSCTQFIAQSLNSLGDLCGVIGTLGYGFHEPMKDTGYTTPDAVVLQLILAQLYCEHANTVAMEVSSQGLHQGRVNGVKFDVAVFTNLSRDHLDYHGSMDSYGESKLKLFTREKLKAAIVNADDPFATTILNRLPGSVKSYTFSIADKRCDVFASDLQLLPGGYAATVVTPWGEGQIKGALLGYFNFSNVLAVITTLLTLQDEKRAFSLAQILAAVSQLKPVSGRMEIVGGQEDITAVVDYAHTPDALKSALIALRAHFTGDIWCVFGCGGNRDQGKRPLMAEVAELYANYSVVTDDNPRNESADDIVRQIMLGVEDKSRFHIERDRAAAIVLAISKARPGDVVLVAGKGHESYQDIGGNRMVFSDFSQVRLALNSRLKSNLGRHAQE